MRRTRSPLQEMDSIVGELDFDEAPATPPSATPVTLEAIAGLLDAKLSPVVQSVYNLKKEVAELKGMQPDIERLQASMAAMQIRVEKLEHILPTGPVAPHQVPDWLSGKLSEMESELDGIKAARPDHANDAEEKRTAVVGGLSSSNSLDNASQWLMDELRLQSNRHLRKRRFQWNSVCQVCMRGRPQHCHPDAQEAEAAGKWRKNLGKGRSADRRASRD